MQNHPIKGGHSKLFDVFDNASSICCYVLKQKHWRQSTMLGKLNLRICGPGMQWNTIPPNVDIGHGLMFLMMSQLLAGIC
ncbi:jg27760 [Pararge aegeria aegeria]|uniref:Jg27760 protein n=1 Tax=Pararge aegeria aegeria TaxID=348720 RepID=A0A8S4QTT0_9NEOP|nr:jg27760 [Pararge aegeria aegeria]